MDEEEQAIEAEVREMLGPERSSQVPYDMMLRFVRGYFYEAPRAPKTYEVLCQTLCVDNSYLIALPSSHTMRLCPTRTDLSPS
eukprot:SAG11_NODE_3507_length_2406_cov_1.843520_2_plen_83_part_00